MIKQSVTLIAQCNATFFLLPRCPRSSPGSENPQCGGGLLCCPVGPSTVWRRTAHHRWSTTNWLVDRTKKMNPLPPPTHISLHRLRAGEEEDEKLPLDEAELWPLPWHYLWSQADDRRGGVRDASLRRQQHWHVPSQSGLAALRASGWVESSALNARATDGLTATHGLTPPGSHRTCCCCALPPTGLRISLGSRWVRLTNDRVCCLPANCLPHCHSRVTLL